uniref:F-box domain-containing protein n=1 Tax=Steinernema glaseri TaxID=37863 RepID=A0A1I7Z130_9BILA
MDHLSYDLVEEVVGYLPRRDVETIARASSRSMALERWNIAAEDQLDNHDYTEFVVDRLGRRTVGISWKMLQATQKNAFADVVLRHYKNGDPDAFGDLLSNWIQRGGIWEKLRCDGSFPLKKAIEAVAPLFGRNRGRPLELELPDLPDVCINLDLVLLIVDNWWNSDGAFEEKRVAWKKSRRPSVWNRVENKSKRRKKCNHNFIMGEDLDNGYLAHHSGRSSLFLSLEGIRIEKFQPWHLPVDFQWIDSVIAKWKEGQGFYVFGEARNFVFAWKSDQDWDEFKAKYGEVYSYQWLELTHWSEILKLRVSKHRKWFELEVRQKWFTTSELMSLISDWRKGSGETLLNGLTEIEVLVEHLSGDLTKLLDDPVLEYTHPNKNARCVIALQPKPMGPYSDFKHFRVVRISICPSDPQPI